MNGLNPSDNNDPSADDTDKSGFSPNDAPGNAAAVSVVAQEKYRAGEFGAAVELFREAINLAPDNSEHFSDLGVALKAARRFGEAEAILRHAIHLSPQKHIPKINLANLLVARGRASEAEQLYRGIIQSQPTFAGAYQNLGNVLIGQNRYIEAVDLGRRMLAAAPADVRAFAQLSVALERSHLLAEALEVTKAAFELGVSSGLDMTTASFASLTGLTGDLASRPMITARIKAALTERNGVPIYLNGSIDDAALRRFAFLLPYYGVSDASHRKLMSNIGENISKGHQKKSHNKKYGTRIRVGFISFNFGDHPIGHLLSPFFEEHKCLDVDVYLYSTSDRTKDDSGYPERIRRAVGYYRDVATKSDEEISNLIFADQIGILIDLDGYLGGGRPEILARRPAPVQIHWLQHLSGMPAPFIDYTIIDGVIGNSPDLRNFNSEIIRLNSAFQCGDRVSLPNRLPSRISVGLPADGFVFCGFNNWLKLDTDTFSAWMDILRAESDSVLWLSSGPKNSDFSGLRRAAAASGVDPDRLIFAPRMANKRDHLARHRCADLFLDSFAFSAATTAVDALWAGLPVLSKRGDSAYSRLSASLIAAVGLPEMIVTDRSEFIDLALEFSSGRRNILAVRQKLIELAPKSKLFDAQLLVRQFGAIYQRCWSTFTENRSTSGFDISEDFAAVEQRL